MIRPHLERSLLMVLLLTLLPLSCPTLAHFGDPPHPVAPAEILTWSPEQRLQGFRSYAEIFPTREITARGAVFPLNDAPQDFSNLSYDLDSNTYSLEDYLQRARVAGVIVVHRGKVLYERYRHGSSPSTLWISYSITKSVVSMLYGAAIADGYIHDVNDPLTDYLPRLAGGAYEGVTIRQLLQMSSGVAWREDYVDPTADVSQSPNEILAFIDYMQALPRAAESGSTFNYSTGETNLAGAVLRAAIGNNLATYLTHKIWQPFGMQAHGNWMLDAPGGVEWGGCCISATLRDYARVGLFAMGGGRAADGSQVLPAQWMAESTAPSQNYPGYGYFWWLRPNGAYAAVGIYGQMIWIHPGSQTVIAMHSAWPEAASRELGAHRWAVVDAIAAAIAGRE